MRSSLSLVGMAAVTSMVAVLGATTPAWAAPSPRDVSDAEQDFTRARQLMADGKDLEQACALFAESNRLDPGTGTLLNLAICQEKVGKIASAWADYNDVLAQSKQENRPDRIDIAQKKIAELTPRLSSVSFVVSTDANVTGLVLSLDGRDRDAGLWSVEKYIDPGAHEVKATAPGKVAWTTTVTVAGDHQQLKVEVPKLADAPTPPTPVATGTANPTPTPPPAPKQADPGRRMVGFLVGGVGVAGLAVGTVFGIEALSKNSDSKTACANGCAKDTNYTAANRDAWIADIALPVGAVAVGVGAYLILTARGGEPESAGTSGATASRREEPRGVSSLMPSIGLAHGGGTLDLAGHF